MGCVQFEVFTSAYHMSNHVITNYLITKSEVVTGKSQTEASPY